MKLYIGDKLPNFSYDTPTHSNNELYEAIGNKSATIIFFRDSACLFTAYYIEMLHRNYRYFKDGNRVLICVVQGHPSEFEGYSKLEFPLICDAELLLYKTFDLPKVTFPLSLLSVEALRIIDEAKRHNIPYEKSLKRNVWLPVTILTDQDKTIEHIHRSQSLTDIPELLVLLGGSVKKNIWSRH